jgi:hypothetical protein
VLNHLIVVGAQKDADLLMVAKEQKLAQESHIAEKIITDMFNIFINLN